MMRDSLLLVAMCSLLSMPGCGAEQTGGSLIESQQAKTAIYRGTVTFSEQARSFVPCADDLESLWIADGSELLGETGAQFEQFVVIEGTRQPAPSEGPGAEFAAAIAIEYVLYAFVQEGPGCDFEWDSFHYRARGNEPFWMLEVSDDGMRLVRPGEQDERWPEVTVADTAYGLVFRPRRSADPAPPVTVDPAGFSTQLVIRREPCRDSMSGAYFGHSAEFIFAGQTFTGCAMTGAPPASAGGPAW